MRIRTDNPSQFNEDLEPFYTYTEAAALLNLPEVKLERAARAAVIPTYTFQNKRKLVRLSEVVAAITRTRTGGQS